MPKSQQGYKKSNRPCWLTISADGGAGYAGWGRDVVRWGLFGHQSHNATVWHLWRDTGGKFWSIPLLIRTELALKLKTCLQSEASLSLINKPYPKPCPPYLRYLLFSLSVASRWQRSTWLSLTSPSQTLETWCKLCNWDKMLRVSEREEEEERERERENRMLNVSSHVHFTPLKKIGCAGIIIALEQHRVRVKEKVEEKRLCKRWRAMNSFLPLWFIFTKGSWPRMMCSSHFR